jgi:hypothetical protein
LLFFTCFGQLCAHHQEKIPYLCDTWYFSLYVDDSGMKGVTLCIPDSHLYRVTCTKCRVGTVFSPDDGHVFDGKNVEKSNKCIKKNCEQSWFCLQDYSRMHGQQNMKLFLELVNIAHTFSYALPLKYYWSYSNQVKWILYNRR